MHTIIRFVVGSFICILSLLSENETEKAVKREVKSTSLFFCDIFINLRILKHNQMKEKFILVVSLMFCLPAIYIQKQLNMQVHFTSNQIAKISFDQLPSDLSVRQSVLSNQAT